MSQARRGIQLRRRGYRIRKSAYHFAAATKVTIIARKTTSRKRRVDEIAMIACVPARVGACHHNGLIFCAKLLTVRV
jgi:hypothetical protein